uniref:KN homeodomain domain-containing protein n=1 Tax=Amphimedon queenslandica TaxID=400682 RepID=A0A1X7UUE7_AMPQE
MSETKSSSQGSHSVADGSKASQEKGSSSPGSWRNTDVLALWITEHLQLPYPGKVEKQYLCFYSNMSMKQVSTYFANARR